MRDEVDFLICDTAGRIHTRDNLMSELGKIRRTLAKQDSDAPHRTLLVVDASTGSNALNQAREFHKSAQLDGLIVTKLDGSDKGGVVVAINDQLGIGPHFIGTGEEPDRFAPFVLGQTGGFLGMDIGAGGNHQVVIIQHCGVS